jgi:hypothetical protein
MTIPFKLVLPALTIFLFFNALFAGRAYVEQSKNFRQHDLSDLAQTNWNNLGESFATIAPEAPLVNRIKDIERYLKPDDTLLILSPFDHLLMFYTNPRKICGHYELLTNLATKQILDKVVQCATQSHHVLIAYDNASETPCPTNPLQTGSRCKFKAVMKHNLVDVRDAVIPVIDEVGTTKDMTFYRVPDYSAPK